MAFCSLCTCKNENILHLYDETGQPNKIYNTIVQYFNPMVNISKIIINLLIKLNKKLIL